MKRKKWFGLVLVCILLLQAVLPVAVAEETTKRITWKKYSNVANAGFEDVLAAAPREWTLSGGNVNDGFSIETGKGNVHSGENSLKMALEAKDRPMYVAQTVSGARGGTEYTVSFWVKIVEKNDRGIAIKIEDPRGGMIVQKHFGDAILNRWTQQSFTFILPEGDTSFNILLRLWDGGEVYWDDIAVTGQYDAEADVTVEMMSTPLEPAVPKVPEVAPEDELFKNGDFETLTDDGLGVKDWNAYNGWKESNKQVTLSTEDPYSGETCVHIATATNERPHISQFVTGLMEETKYQFSIWYKTDAHNVAFKLEYYTGGEKAAVETRLDGFSDGRLEVAEKTGGQWQQYVTTFTTPPGAKCMAIYPRLYCNGDVYFDKASLSVAVQSRIKFSTDEIFYYSDRTEEAVAEAVPNTLHFEGLENHTVTFALKDGETVLEETERLSLDKKVQFRFSPLSMTELQKDYSVEAAVYDPNGTLLETRQQTVSRWDRPTRISADGKYMVDGEEFVPVIAYNLPQSAYPLCKEVGINVVQFAMTANLKTTLETLDAAQENGLMVLACLYANVKPSAHPDNIENTKKIVNAVKDHPAVFAYAVLDEPHLQWNNHDDLFQKSYKLIRSIDKDRPIYLVEAEGNWMAYETTAKYCDFFTVDPYSETEEIVVDVEKHIRLAQEAVKYKKPVAALFKTYGEETGHFPTIDELRYEFYRAFMLGVSGVGIFRYNAAFTAVDKTTKPLSGTQLWEDWKAFKTEFQEAIADFITNPKPVFTDIKAEDYYARSYVKDGKITLVLLNRTNEAKTVSVPLTSGDGTLSVGAYTAAVLGEDRSITGEGALEWELPAGGVEVFAITPIAAMDFSGLYPSRFADLEGYGWARTQIDALDAAGVVNDRTYKSFGPGEKITRGEFAYFLVRTLGLTADTDDNFSDVAENAFYAKEIAVGKQLGILKGMGNNLYGAETEISRQDLMVICARAMQLAPTDEEISFPDKALIADYALADVAAMVRANIVRGNADGTINPLGDTTRAEAAVIMRRIQEWAKEP